MRHGKRAPDDLARDPRLAAVLDDIKPYAAAAGAVSILGAPVEFGVPIVRRLRGRSGVSIGPGLVNLTNGILALGAVGYFRQRPERWQRWKHERIGPRAGLAALAYVALSPAAAAGSERTVILRGRTPLWGELISPIGLIQIALLLVALHRAGRARSSGTTRASVDEVQPPAAHHRDASSAEGPACGGIEDERPGPIP